MHAQYFIFNEPGHGHNVKQINEFPPKRNIIPAPALLVKAIYPRNVLALVIASQESDVRRVLHLEAEEELEGLDRVEATIDEVAHENVAGVRDFTAFVEQLEKIVELAVDVSANRDRSLDWLDVAFLDEDFLDFLAEDTKLPLREDGALFHSLEPAVDVTLTHFGAF